MLRAPLLYWRHQPGGEESAVDDENKPDDEELDDEEKPDDSKPTPERQAELREAYDANVASGKAPYAGVSIRTLDELSCIMRERDWSGGEFARDENGSSEELVKKEYSTPMQQLVSGRRRGRAHVRDRV
jgi:hypothetical protein